MIPRLPKQELSCLIDKDQLIYITGGPEGLLRLSEALLFKDGLTSIECSPIHPLPNGFVTSFSSIQIQRTPLMLRVIPLETSIGIEGNEKVLTTLATNISGLANAVNSIHDGLHLHIEYYEDHPYVHPDSFPLIISLSAI